MIAAPAVPYTITFHLMNGDAFALPSTDLEPEIEKLTIGDDVEFVEVTGPQPMEHELMIEDASLENKQILYTAQYFPNAAIIDYNTAQDRVNVDDIEALRMYAYESIAYGHRFIGQDGKKRPEDLKYIYNATSKRIHIFSVNCAVLEKIPENSQGIQWKKINTATLELEMV